MKRIIVYAFGLSVGTLCLLESASAQSTANLDMKAQLRDLVGVPLTLSCTYTNESVPFWGYDYQGIHTVTLVSASGNKFQVSVEKLIDRVTDQYVQAPLPVRVRLARVGSTVSNLPEIFVIQHRNRVTSDDISLTFAKSNVPGEFMGPIEQGIRGAIGACTLRVPEAKD